MLSKEEIESKLEQTEDDEITINLLYQEVDLLKSELDQLETNNKKIIEKLEEVINDDDMSDVEYQMKRELAIEILKITKGEKG